MTMIPRRAAELTGKCAILLVSLWFSYIGAFWAAKTYFFDKFFYQKSIEYGYWVNKNGVLEDFGKRSKDLTKLIDAKIPPQQPSSAVLGVAAPNNEMYTIFVIGDSYVFGQGIRQEDRFSENLEKKLNTLRKTKVYIYGNSGNSLVEDYFIYKKALSVIGAPDLIIMGLVSNDLFVNTWCLTLCEEKKELFDLCDGDAIYSEFENQYNPESVQSFDYDQLVMSSMEKNTKNYCVFQKLSPLLPKQKTIYFHFDATRFPTLEKEEKFIRLFKDDSIFILDTAPYVKQHYRPIFNEAQGETQSGVLNVSEKDGHPSAFANKIYAEALYEEIVGNSRWGFVAK